MNLSQKTRTNLNRVVALAIGGALVYFVMSVTLVASAQTELAQLQEQLDTALYEPSRLLKDATDWIATGEEARAKDALSNLLTRHPSSPEAIEGKIMATSLEAREKKAADAWDLAVVDLRRKWNVETSARLRSQFESGLTASLEQEWERAQADLRAEWETKHNAAAVRG